MRKFVCIKSFRAQRLIREGDVIFLVDGARDPDPGFWREASEANPPYPPSKGGGEEALPQPVAEQEPVTPDVLADKKTARTVKK